MATASVGARSVPPATFRTRRLLFIAPDERLVEQIRGGNDGAFEIVFERYAPALLTFCRHMLSSREEAEDALQLTFAAAYSALRREPERAVVLKPWLFTIARNRCLSILRARREQPAELPDIRTDGLADRAEERAELRQIFADMRELPEEQRAALLLAEVSDLSHAQVADVLGCEVARVKALVFRARSGLIDRRTARETPCAEIQEQLANLRGGSLRRTPLRLHLRQCATCRTYREEVRTQRRLLAAALPVTPALGLKSSVLAAVGSGGGSAAGGLAAGLGSVAGALGGGALVKIAVVAGLAGGSAIAVPAVVDSRREAEIPQPNVTTHQSENKVAGTAPAAIQGRPGGRPEASPPGRGPLEGRGEARGRLASSSNGVSPELTKRTAKGAPPGHAPKTAEKRTPPGQAKKSVERTVPPGQAKRDAKAVPPGQETSSQSVPGGGGASGGSGKNGGMGSGKNGGMGVKTEAPTQPAPKAEKKTPPAPPVAQTAPAAPPPEKPKQQTKP